MPTRKLIDELAAHKDAAVLDPEASPRERGAARDHHLVFVNLVVAHWPALLAYLRATAVLTAALKAEGAVDDVLDRRKRTDRVRSCLADVERLERGLVVVT